MTQEPWITLEPELLLGIPDLDQQHRRIVFILNNLNEAVKQADDSKELTSRLFDEMVEYVRFHFRHEERLMARMGYPDELAHTVAHLALMDEVMHLRARFMRGEEFEVLVLLKDWVLLHIVSSDKRLAEFLSAFDNAAKAPGLGVAGATQEGRELSP